MPCQDLRSPEETGTALICARLGCSGLRHEFFRAKFDGESGIWEGIRILVMPVEYTAEPIVSWEPHTGLRAVLTVRDGSVLRGERGFAAHYHEGYTERCELGRDWWAIAYADAEEREAEGKLRLTNLLLGGG